MIQELEHRIRERAHDIWESEGRPSDRAEIHWSLARAEITAQIPAETPAETPAEAPKRAAAKAPAKPGAGKAAAPRAKAAPKPS